MDATMIVGFAAGFLTTVAFVPQVTKIWKSRSAKDISVQTFLAFTLGVGLWLVYGILMGELPMIVWNGVTLVLAGAILVMKRKFG
jgi:MtN3 and saliva related transmembrane protein